MYKFKLFLVLIFIIFLSFFWVKFYNDWKVYQENYYTTHGWCFEREWNQIFESKVFSRFPFLNIDFPQVLTEGTWIFPISAERLYTSVFELDIKWEIIPYHFAIYELFSGNFVPHFPSGFGYLSEHQISEKLWPLSPESIKEKTRFFAPYGFEKGTILSCTNSELISGKWFLIPNANLDWQLKKNASNVVSNMGQIFLVFQVPKGAEVFVTRRDNFLLERDIDLLKDQNLIEL